MFARSFKISFRETFNGLTTMLIILKYALCKTKITANGLETIKGCAGSDVNHNIHIYEFGYCQVGHN